MMDYDDGKVYELLLRNGLDYLPSEINEGGFYVEDFADVENIECEGNEITGHCLIECSRDGFDVEFNSDFVIQVDDDGDFVSVEFLEVEMK